ncbi:unnamed protein product [Anisakis simplex]|uniref:Uncharacterized protein n=1 Tax=Anisakis simplex TaxID=6269 RepID=A0A0M3J043_ANISI|nr:unnamed protein product [Anisakis simplex]
MPCAGSRARAATFLVCGVQIAFQNRIISIVIPLHFGTFSLKARTSGVLLVAGVGSYMVYRMFVRFLGQNFMWTLVNQTRVDTLNRSDIRLLHPANVLRTSECCSSMFADDEYSSGETGSVVSACTKNTFISTEYSRSRRRYLSSRSARNRSHPTPLRKRDERKAMKGEPVDENCQKKEFTPTHHVYCRSFSARSESEASRGLSQISITPSEKSASLRLIWDDPQWDSEVDLNGQGLLLVYIEQWFSHAGVPLPLLMV